MPEEAATWRKERAEKDTWTQQDELMAGLIESNGAYLHAVCYLLHKAHFKGEPKLGAPPQINHPSRQHPKPERRVTSDGDAIRRFFSNN